MLQGFDEKTAEDIIKLYLKAQVQKTGKDFVEMGLIPQNQVDLVLEKTGIDISGYYRRFEFSEARHIFLQHGRFEKGRGQKNVEPEDLLLIPIVVNNPSTIKLSSTKRGNKLLIYEKKLGDLTIYCEEIIGLKKKVIVKTFYTKRATLLGSPLDLPLDAQSPQVYVRNGLKSGVNIHKKSDSINGRVNTLRAKKNGNDMFPDLAGFNEDTAEQIINLYLKAQTKKTGDDQVILGKVSPAQKKKLKAETGIDFSGYTRIFKFNEARHIWLEHGQNEHLRGQKNIEAEDLLLIPLVINNPTKVIYQKEKSKQGNGVIRYEKKLSDYIIFCEENFESDKTLAVKTFLIKRATLLGGPTETFLDAQSLPVNVHNVKNQRGVNIANIQKPSQLISKKYNELSFDGEYLKLLAKPAEGFKLMLSAAPGVGKTYWALKFAKYLSKFGPVLYASSEEFGTSTFSKKLNEIKVPDSVDMAAGIKGIDLRKYKFVFINSINDMKIDLEHFKAMKKTHPHTAFILILQQTKDNKFRGSNEWPHEVDIVVEGTAPRKFSTTKNRYR